MNVLFFDSVNTYSTASEGALKWKGGAYFLLVSNNGRGGSKSVQLSSAGTDFFHYLRHNLAANQASLVFGARIYFDSGPPFGSNDILEFRDAGSPQLTVRSNADGTLTILAGATELATSTQTIGAVATAYYLEFKGVIDSTTGSYELRVNGDTWLSASGVDTQDTANAYATEVICGCFAGPTTHWSDFYITDGTFLGQVRCDYLAPGGNGTYSQWVGSDSDSTNNYLHVDEIGNDGDTSYVQSGTTGNKDSYTLAAVPTGTNVMILAVQEVAIARKSDAGVASFKQLIRTGGTDYTATVAASDMATTYGYYTNIRETNPGTASAWTETEVNALEAGVEVA